MFCWFAGGLITLGRSGDCGIVQAVTWNDSQAKSAGVHTMRGAIMFDIHEYIPQLKLVIQTERMDVGG